MNVCACKITSGTAESYASSKKLVVSCQYPCKHPNNSIDVWAANIIMQIIFSAKATLPLESTGAEL